MVVLLAAYDVPEPQSYAKAINGLHAKQGFEGVHSEFEAQIASGTWDVELVDLSPDRKAVNREWVFKVKPDSRGDGQIQDYIGG